MMRKLLTLLLCAALLLSAAACGGGDDVPDTPIDDPIDDEPAFSGPPLEGTVWVFGDGYLAFGSGEAAAVYDMFGENPRPCTYYWDGKNGQLQYDDGTVYFLEAYENDPRLEEFLYVTNADDNMTEEYRLCAELPEGVAIPEGPVLDDDSLEPQPLEPDPMPQPDAPGGGSGGYEIPESMRPTFEGGLSVEESRIGENLNGRVGSLPGTSWMTGDDVYTFFDDGFVDAVNILVGGQALGTYDVSDNGSVLCLMDNGAEISMYYDGSSLSINGNGMMQMSFDNDRRGPHLFNGEDSLVGSAWLDPSTDVEYCMLANGVLALYDPESADSVIGSYRWDDNATGMVSVLGHDIPVHFDRGHVFADTGSGAEPLFPVYAERESAEFLGMERVLCGDWTWSEDPTLTINFMLVGAGYSYDNENGSGTVYAETQYDGRTLTFSWPPNDGSLGGVMTGVLGADGCLYFDGWDGCFVRS